MSVDHSKPAKSASDKPPPPPDENTAPEGMEADVPPSAVDDETAFADQAQARAAEDNPALGEALRRAAEAAAEALNNE